jgi:hypothetical protein
MHAPVIPAQGVSLPPAGYDGAGAAVQRCQAAPRPATGHAQRGQAWRARRRCPSSRRQLPLSGLIARRVGGVRMLRVERAAPMGRGGDLQAMKPASETSDSWAHTWGPPVGEGRGRKVVRGREVASPLGALGALWAQQAEADGFANAAAQAG